MNRGVFLGLALFVLAGTLVRAEDMKTRKDRTFTSEDYGCTWVKPEAAEWQNVQGGDQDRFFSGGAGKCVALMARYATATPDKQKDNPMVFFVVMPLDVAYFDKYGKKGLAQEIYKENFQKDYKEVKDLQEATTQTYPFGSVAEFGFTGVNSKYNNPRTERVLCYKFKKNGFLIEISGLPDMMKKYAADVNFILQTLQFYEPKK